jgi:hypothetical protein
MLVTLIGLVALVATSASGQDAAKCLPPDVHLDQIVSYGRTAKENITVAKKLRELNARCHHGKLVDHNKREIRFFRVSCWGHPPPDYLEIKEQERIELAKLKKTYTVVVMSCDPRIP